MTANYSFGLGNFALQRASPAHNFAGQGTISDIAFVPGATEADDQLAIIRQGTFVLIARGSGTPFSTVVTRATANMGITTGANNSVCFIPSASGDPADDLIAISNSSAVQANNTISLVRRGTGNFAGAATADGINRWLIANANIGVNNMRGICFLPDAVAAADDLLFITSTSGNAMKLRRTSGSTPFPGAATADGINRWSITRDNYLGNAAANVADCCFVPHPTDPAEDALAAVNVTGGFISLTRRGTAAEKFVGGAGNRTNLTDSVLSSFSNYGLDFAVNPEASASSAYLAITALGTAGIKFFSNDFSLAQAITNQNSPRGLAVLPAADPWDSLFAVCPNTTQVDFYYLWRANFQPVADPTQTNIGAERSPVLVNTGDVTLTANATYYEIDRTIASLIPFFNRSYTWVRDTETSATLNTDWIFQGTAVPTGNYAIAIEGASVFLGTLSTYSASFTLDGTSTLVLQQNVEITEDFVLSAGTEVVADDGTGPYTLTIPYADPGLVLGTGISLAAPTATVTLTQLIPGSEVRIFATGTRDEMAGSEAIAGTTFEFEPTGAFDIRVFKVGYQVFRQVNVAAPSTDQSIQVNQLIDRGYTDAP